MTNHNEYDGLPIKLFFGDVQYPRLYAFPKDAIKEARQLVDGFQLVKGLQWVRVGDDTTIESCGFWYEQDGSTRVGCIIRPITDGGA